MDNLNTIKDLLSEEELANYEATCYPYNISILHSALKLKLQEDPSYEVWAPLVYYKLVGMAKSNNLVVRPHKVFISNKGDILSTRRASPLVLTQSISENGYKVAVISVAGRDEIITVHRAMACSFVPLSEDVGNQHPKDLQVNHIDGVKLNIDLGNLEWTTPKRNVEHAFETGLIVKKKGAESGKTKPVKGTILSGDRAGYEFVLFGTKDCEKNGFTPSLISKVVAGLNQTHKNCSWVFATEEEIKTLPKGIQ